MASRVATRLYVEEPLGPETVLGLGREQAHFLRSVLRLSAGDLVAVFNGVDGEWLAAIDGLGKGWASLSLTARLREQTASPDIRLLFAPIKRARLDFLVQKATELGVSVLQPVITERTVVERVRGERLEANVREAAEQCERLDAPRIMPPVPLAEALADWTPDMPLYVCVESGEATPFAEVLQGRPAEARGAGLLTGPEGGFSERELEKLSITPFAVAIGLGPRILRAETAALAALAIWQAWHGDGRERPPPRSFPGSLG